MEIVDGHIRHILLYYFGKGKNAGQTRKKLYDVYGEKSLTERQCQSWFAYFRSGDFVLKVAPRSGHPTEVDDEKIKTLIENNRSSTTGEIAEELNISHTCVERHLKQLGYVNNFDIWVPHKLNEIQLSDPRTLELAVPTTDPTSSWLLPRSTAIGWLNEEDTMSSRHLWWGPPAPMFWYH